MPGLTATLTAALAAASLALAPPGESGPRSAGGPPATPGIVSPAGRIVTAIELRSARPLRDPQALLDMVDLEIGKEWQDSAVRHTLRNLYLTGSVSEAEIYAVDDPGPGGAAGVEAAGAPGTGVRAILAVWPSVEVREVRLEGKLGLPKADLQSVIEVRVAEPLVEDQVLRSVQALQDLYRDNGYFSAGVHLKVVEDAATSEATIAFALDPGARSAIGEVTLEGDLAGLRPADVLKNLQSRPGKPYRRQALRDDQDRIQRNLIGRGFRLAEVEAPREEPDAATRRVRLIFPVKIGPAIEVEMRGADLEALRKKGLLPFLGNEGYDEALIIQAVDRIRDDFQSRGHYQVKVDRLEDRKRAGRIHLLLTVTPGAQFTLEDVRFDGNHGVSDGTLADLMTTSPRRLLRPGSGRLVDGVLKLDLANIRSYYALQGYTRAKVGPEAVEVRGRDLRLTIPILEGPRAVVHSLALDGVHKVPESRVLGLLPLRVGGPFHPLVLQDGVNALRSLYDDLGYDSVQISSDVAWDAPRTAADVTLHVLEGPQSTLDRVIVRGNVRTKTAIIKRFIDLRPGEPVSRQRLFDAQRELYKLGVFSRVDFDFLSAGDDTASRDVRLRLEEGAVHRYTYGVGYDSEKGANGALGFAHRNLFGRALALQADAKVGQHDRQYRLLLSQPYLGQYRVPARLSLFLVEERQSSFDSRRRGVQLEVGRPIGALRLGGLYTYKIVNTLNLDPSISIDQIERDLTPVEISSITASALYDRRDDAIDPHRGYSLATQLEYAFPLLTANERFLKLISQATYQRPLGKQGVIAGSIRLGAIEALTRACQPGVEELDPASCSIPLSERFFAGGRSTHRAYGRDQLGIPGNTLDGTTPVGGTGLALVNLDYRFPVYASFGGVLFADSGNIWGDWREVRFDKFKTGLGLGVRYASPVGPIRLEISWKLDRQPKESPYEVYFSFGTPF